MATVGDQLTEPELGWKRFDDTEELFEFIGDFSYVSSSSSYNGGLMRCNSGGTLKFQFKGTKIRILAVTTGTGSQNISVKIDDSVDFYSIYNSKSFAQVIVYEKIGLNDGFHKVIIEEKDGLRFDFDAIDIDENGSVHEFDYDPFFRKTLIQPTQSTNKFYSIPDKKYYTKTEDEEITKRNLEKCGVLQLKFEDPNNLSYDSLGNNYELQSSYATYSADGFSGRGLGLLGGDLSWVKYIEKITPVGEKSIRFKVKTTQQKVGVILDNVNGSSSSNSGTHVSISSSIEGVGHISFRVGNGSSSIVSLQSIKKVNDGEWHDVLITWDGTTNENGVKIYIDDFSEPDVQGTATGIESNEPKYTLSIGANSLHGDVPFIGVLDEIEMYNKVIENPYERSVVKQLTEVTEDNFINHGMDAEKQIDMDKRISFVEYVNYLPTTLGSGRVFEQPIDRAIKGIKIE